MDGLMGGRDLNVIFKCVGACCKKRDQTCDQH